MTRTAEHLDAANASNASKSSEVQCLSPSNKTTVVEERSSSPAGVRIIFYEKCEIEKFVQNILLSSILIIDAIKKRKIGKPIKALTMNTHHQMGMHRNRKFINRVSQVT